MNESLAKARDNFIEGVRNLALTVRISRVVGQLYTMLFLSKQLLCLDDMVDKPGISKGNASINIRELEQLGVGRKFIDLPSSYWRVSLEKDKNNLDDF